MPVSVVDSGCAALPVAPPFPVSSTTMPRDAQLRPDELHDDDQPVGQWLTRRQVLGLFTAPILLGFAGCDSTTDGTTDEPITGSCVARPELTEGPYYVDENLNRSDLRADSATGAVREGALLALTFNVSRIAGNACSVLENALVDVWHCDAQGNYSDVGSFSGQDFLRGYQITDANGTASFTTIYPGWYRGRAVHIHFKVRSSAASGSAYEFTSQLFFDDDLSREVFSTASYEGTQDTFNAEDGIYGQGGAQTLLAVTETDEGYAATFNIALYLD